MRTLKSGSVAVSEKMTAHARQDKLRWTLQRGIYRRMSRVKGDPREGSALRLAGGPPVPGLTEGEGAGGKLLHLTLLPPVPTWFPTGQTKGRSEPTKVILAHRSVGHRARWTR